jgi:hypothetical protein
MTFKCFSLLVRLTVWTSNNRLIEAANPLLPLIYEEIYGKLRIRFLGCSPQLSRPS